MEENNKIIAEFMGLNKTKMFFNLKTGNYVKKETDDCDIKVVDVYLKNNKPIVNFYYHSDWNWLMEVVEKIESIKDSYHGRFGVYISSNSCTIQSTNFRPDKPIPNPPHYYDNIVLNTKIESVYYSVINFINFYNKQKEE